MCIRDRPKAQRRGIETYTRMSGKNKLALLKKLQKARSNKSSKDVLDEQLDEESVYDLVDEDQYRTKKRQELLRDDFVEDDDGSGYVDRGIDEWQQKHEYYSDDELDIKQSHGKKHKTAKDTIGDMVKQQNVKKRLAPAAEKSKKVTMDDFNDILNDFDSGPAIKKPKLIITKRQQHSSAAATPYKLPRNDGSPLKSKQHAVIKSSDVPALGSDDIEDDQEVRLLLNEVNSSPTMVKQPVYQNDGDSNDDDDDSNDDDDDIHFGRKTVKSIACLLYTSRCV